MGRPLPHSYNPRPAAVMASLGALICIVAVARSQVSGWLSAVVLVVAIWVAFLGVVHLRTRAYLEVDGRRAIVRRYGRLQTVEATDLVAVKEFLTPHGPCYRLTVRSAAGRNRRVIVPAALLRGGHSTLLGWILTEAPEARLDRQTLRTVERLRARGLLAEDATS